MYNFVNINYFYPWAVFFFVFFFSNFFFWTLCFQGSSFFPRHCSEMRLLKNAFIFLLVFIGRTDAEADTPMLWLPAVKNWLIWMDPDAGKDWRWEKWMTEDEMVGWHHRLAGHESKQTPGDGQGQGSLEYCSLWSCKESDVTEWLEQLTDFLVMTLQEISKKIFS